MGVSTPIIDFRDSCYRTELEPLYFLHKSRSAHVISYSKIHSENLLFLELRFAQFTGKLKEKKMKVDRTCLNSKQFDPDIPGFGAEVDHGTVAVHRRAGVDDLDTVHFHDAPCLVDVGTADEVE